MAKSRCKAILLAALLLAGCADHLDRGIVVGKDHQDAWTEYTPQYMMTCAGSPPVCTQTLIGMTPTFWPATWTLHFKDGDKTGDHDVGEAEFEKYKPGDRYP